MKRTSKRDIYRKGENLGGWPCDMGPDGTKMENGSVERLMYYEGSYYFVYTGFFDRPVSRVQKIRDREVLELVLIEDGLVGELILRHHRARARA
jgi:hypothetical protein